MKKCRDCKEDIEEDASKCPKCRSRQEGLSRFAEWLQAWQTLILSLGFLMAIWQLQFTQDQLTDTKKQIRENNRQIWSNYLDQKSLESSKLAIEREYLGCIHYWPLSILDINCANEVYSKENVMPLLEYVEKLIEHFKEVMVFSMENDKTYYEVRYVKWATNLGKDRYGVVRCIISHYAVCRSKGDCTYMSYDLKICPEQTIDECASWLEFGRRYFLSMTGNDNLRGAIDFFSDLPLKEKGPSL
jgi:hypothetical protein